jgi:integrase
LTGDPVNSLVNKTGLRSHAMASVRTRARKNGTEYYAVLYRLNGKQTSTSFEDFASASKFCDLATKYGPENALRTLRVDTTLATLTVEQWVKRHIDVLTGVDQNTIDKYRTYLRNDIAEPLGALPLTALGREHIAQWVKGMQQTDDKGWTPSAKTIANKHGFLAGALNAAVAAGHISANPCTGVRLPRDDDAHEMLFLSREQFKLLRDSVNEYWEPLVEFLVASGCRWGEAVALRPSDIDRAATTVRIVRSWKYGSGGYRLGAPKTPKSKRTINVPTSVLDKLDYSHEWLFINRAGGPVRAQGFSARVWAPALERAWPSVDANGGPIKDRSQILRPRIHDLRHTCASWLIQDGVPLPVIQQHLGHESIQTTVTVYGHLDRRSMEAAADAIGRALDA